MIAGFAIWADDYHHGEPPAYCSTLAVLSGTMGVLAGVFCILDLAEVKTCWLRRCSAKANGYNCLLSVTAFVLLRAEWTPGVTLGILWIAGVYIVGAIFCIHWLWGIMTSTICQFSRPDIPISILPRPSNGDINLTKILPPQVVHDVTEWIINNRVTNVAPAVLFIFDDINHHYSTINLLCTLKTSKTCM